MTTPIVKTLIDEQLDEAKATPSPRHFPSPRRHACCRSALPHQGRLAEAAPHRSAEAMPVTRCQKARRWAFWRGSFATLFICTAWMLASAWAGCITS